MNQIDEQWQRPLADAAIFFARHETQGHIADRIMNDGRFTQTDDCRQVRKAAVEMLVSATGVASYKPAEIQRLVSWAMPNDPAVEQQQWRQIAQRLRRALGRGKETRGPATTGPTAHANSFQPLNARGVDRVLASAMAEFITRISRNRREAIVRGPDRPAVVADVRKRSVRVVGKTFGRTKKTRRSVWSSSLAPSTGSPTGWSTPDVRRK